MVMPVSRYEAVLSYAKIASLSIGQSIATLNKGMSGGRALPYSADMPSADRDDHHPLPGRPGLAFAARPRARWINPTSLPKSSGEVAASYADGGVMSITLCGP